MAGGPIDLASSSSELSDMEDGSGLPLPSEPPPAPPAAQQQEGQEGAGVVGWDGGGRQQDKGKAKRKPKKVSVCGYGVWSSCWAGGRRLMTPSLALAYAWASQCWEHES